MKNNKSNIGNLLTTEESAKYSGLKMQSFRNLVSRHIGPKLDHKEGLRCYYHKKELDRWNMIRLKRAPLAKKKVSPKKMIKIAMTRGQNKGDVMKTPPDEFSFTVHVQSLLRKYESKLFKDRDVLVMLKEIIHILKLFEVQVNRLYDKEFEGKKK
jgi:hypothetical protein